jgi:hypothetical protein
MEPVKDLEPFAQGAQGREARRDILTGWRSLISEEQETRAVEMIRNDPGDTLLADIAAAVGVHLDTILRLMDRHHLWIGAEAAPAAPEPSPAEGSK